MAATAAATNCGVIVYCLSEATIQLPRRAAFVYDRNNDIPRLYG